MLWKELKNFLVMGRGLSLSVNNRVQDPCMIRAGQPRQRVATVFVVAKRTISRLVVDTPFAMCTRGHRFDPGLLMSIA